MQTVRIDTHNNYGLLAAYQMIHPQLDGTIPSFSDPIQGGLYLSHINLYFALFKLAHRTLEN